MSLVQNPIDALFNGVSQQPAAMRLPSQCEVQINAYASVADGLTKRPPTEHLAKLIGYTGGDAFIHIINRDVTERYAVIVTDGAIQVFSLADGDAVTVIYDAAATYLDLPDGALASESFEIVTVADYSFVVNKTKVVETENTGTAQPAQYSTWYFPKNWTRADDGTRYFRPSIGVDKGNVQTMADLPRDDDPAPPAEGHFYEISGSGEDGFSRFFVIYKGGVWQETHDNGTSIKLDEATMPHALVREGDGDFHLRLFGWIPRLFGDYLSNPVPSFVGTVIKDIGYHKNRLVLAAGENIIFSGAGDYGNFFRNTVTILLDSDVVDIAVSTQSVANVNYILPAENGMMFFSDQTQFVLNVDQLLTPGTASIDVATSYEMNQKVKPISVGQDVYFVSESGNYSRVREYSLGNGDSLETDATDITAHVPRYIPKNVFRLAGNANEDLMLCLTSDEPNRVYPYKFFYSGDQKVQSSWSYWEFAADDEILDIDVLNNQIYFLIKRADGVYLETMDVQATTFPLALDFNILLDRRYQFEAGDKSYDATDTTFTFPYTLTAAEQATVRLVTADGATPGRILDPSQYSFPTSSTVKFVGDWTGVEVLGGLNYVETYEFSEQFHKRNDGSSVTTGRYQLRTITLVFEDMAYFKTTVDPYGTGAQEVTEEIVTVGLVEFTGKTLGSQSLTLGSPTFENGTYDFQVYGNSQKATIVITNDVPFGGKLVSATVEGFYTRRGR